MNIFKQILLGFVLGCCLMTSASAQDFGVEEVVIKQDSFRIPKLILKLPLTGYLRFPLPNISVALEHRFKPDMAMEYELGYVFIYPAGSDTSYKQHGIIARTEFRYYLEEPTRRFNLFVGGQYLLQQEFWSQRADFERAGGNFTQFYTYNELVTTNGLLFSFGGNRVGRNKSRFFFEWKLAAGVRLRTVNNIGVPSDAEVNPDNNFFELPGMEYGDAEAEGTTILPTAQFSLRIGGIFR